MVITKSQSWRVNEENLTICSDFPQKYPRSAVAIPLSKWVANSVIDLGQIGSRIRHFRRRNITNCFIIEVYIPQRKITNPDQVHLYDQSAFLQRFKLLSVACNGIALTIS